MAYAASRAWLVSWDKFVIPWPFSRIAIVVGPPRGVPRAFQASDEAAMAALEAQLEAELHRLARAARLAVA
jgi:lysophospholipid acyltransferase (LPLAT)-like uncharacterized protein